MDPLAGRTPDSQIFTSLRCQNPGKCGEPIGRVYAPSLHVKVLLNCATCGGESLFCFEPGGLMGYFMGLVKVDKARGLAPAR